MRVQCLLGLMVAVGKSAVSLRIISLSLAAVEVVSSSLCSVFSLSNVPSEDGFAFPDWDSLGFLNLWMV